MVPMINHGVTAIIPAFDEGKTIEQAIKAAQTCPEITEIIVVDDGSTDDTFKKAQLKGVQVIRHPSNLGKGQAMEAGVRASKNDIFLFLDADLIGLKGSHLSQLITPVLSREYGMSVGVVDRQKRWGAFYLDFFDYSRWPLAGTRVVQRNFWESVPLKYKRKFYIESAISYLARKRSTKIKRILLLKVSHLVKEKKHGLLKGVFYRLRMSGQIFWVNILLRFSKFDSR